jgi:hypothetical protein
MIDYRNPHSTLRRDVRGTSAVEFALIAPVMFALLLGLMEFGHWAYVRSIAAGALDGVARGAGVGENSVNPRTLESQVEAQIRVVASTATFAWDKKSYYQFSGVGKPEKLTSDNNGNNSYDVGDCWEDLNPNGVYDSSPGRDGIGGADDIVLYKLTVTWTPLIALASLLPGVPNTRNVTVSTMVKRQPFAAQAIPAIRC